MDLGMQSEECSPEELEEWPLKRRNKNHFTKIRITAFIIQNQILFFESLSGNYTTIIFGIAFCLLQG
jgi:hypothetical protein